MAQYFYGEKNKQMGPFTIEELKDKKIKKSTLVWTEGMGNWAPAETLEELRGIILAEPPPLPIQESQIKIVKPKIPFKSSRYDSNYNKEGDATIAGVLLFVGLIIVNVTDWISINSTYYAIAVIVFFILRIIITSWVMSIAKRQNRNTTAWGFFAFFLPSIALIIIGQLKKLRLKIKIDESLPVADQVRILYNKANKLYEQKKFSESADVLNKAIELDNQYFDAIKLRAIANYHIEQYDKSLIDFEILSKNEIDPSETNYFLGNLAIINHDREKAVSYWKKAQEEGNAKAIKKLDLYHTFTGNYVLKDSQIGKKVGDSVARGETFFLFECKYLGDFRQIDTSIVSIESTAQIMGYDNGINIKFRKKFKTYHITIAYYEMSDITFDGKEKTMVILLIDKQLLRFHFQSYQGFKMLCEKFTEATGRIPSGIKTMESYRSAQASDSIIY